MSTKIANHDFSFNFIQGKYQYLVQMQNKFNKGQGLSLEENLHIQKAYDDAINVYKGIKSNLSEKQITIVKGYIKPIKQIYEQIKPQSPTSGDESLGALFRNARQPSKPETVTKETKVTDLEKEADEKIQSDLSSIDELLEESEEILEEESLSETDSTKRYSKEEIADVQKFLNMVRPKNNGLEQDASDIVDEVNGLAAHVDNFAKTDHSPATPTPANKQPKKLGLFASFMESLRTFFKRIFG